MHTIWPCIIFKAKRYVWQNLQDIVLRKITLTKINHSSIFFLVKYFSNGSFWTSINLLDTPWLQISWLRGRNWGWDFLFPSLPRHLVDSPHVSLKLWPELYIQATLLTKQIPLLLLLLNNWPRWPLWPGDRSSWRCDLLSLLLFVFFFLVFLQLGFIFSDEITLQAHKEENGFTNNPGMYMSSCK